MPSQVVSATPHDLAGVAGFGLDPTFADQLATLLMTCRAAGFEFRVSQGLRTPQKQAAYYCQWVKHPVADVDAAVQKLRDRDAPWLADMLSGFRDITRTNRWLTNALPGEGWHQWGLAADCYCFENGKMVSSGDAPCYKFYAEQAVKLGLTAGFNFKQKDAGHVQGPSANGASNVYAWSHIDGVMKSRFADKTDVVR